MLHHIRFIGILNRFGDNGIFYVPSVDEISHEVSVAPAYGGFAYITAYFYAIYGILDVQNFPGNIPAVYVVKDVPNIIIAGGLKD